MGDFIVRVGGITVAAITAQSTDEAINVLTAALEDVTDSGHAYDAIRILPQSDPQPDNT